METRLFLIRHGITTWNKQKRYQGNSDVALAAEGKKQAKALAQLLSNYRIDALYTSPLRRARDTALTIGAFSGKKMTLDGRLRELCFGEWEGKTARDLLRERDPAYARWAKGELVKPTGGESVHSLRERTRAFLRDCLKRHRGKAVVIISHGGTIRLMLSSLLNMPLRYTWGMRLDPASMSIVSVSGSMKQLVLLNQTPYQQ